MEGVPTHPLTVGVTVIFAETGAVPLLVAVNVGILPEPLPGRPIEVFEFVHPKVPPAGVLTKFAEGTVAKLHTVILAGIVTVGVGLTVMVYVDGVPWQLLTVAVTLMVAVIGVDPVLVAVNAGILPLPLAPNPMAVLELLHEKVPPEGILEKFVALTCELLQTVILAGTVTVGVGFTVMV